MKPLTYRIKYSHRNYVGKKNSEFKATKMRFSAYRCFQYDDNEGEKLCFKIIGDYLKSLGVRLAFYGPIPFGDYLLRQAPFLKRNVCCWLTDAPNLKGQEILNIPVKSSNNIPSEVEAVFLTETKVLPRFQMRKRLPDNLTVICPEVIVTLNWQVIPRRAWIPAYETIYPLELPDIAVRTGIDLLLLDCPAKNMGLMPNGLAYVHNALKETGINFQTLDLDIIIYHRFHMHRLLDGPEEIRTPAGMVLPADPWLAENSLLWQNQEVLDYFQPWLAEAVAAITQAAPKILALSVHESNALASARLVEAVKNRLPDTLILVGGYSCLNPDIGFRAFPLADYMVIGEADLVVGPLVKRLLAGELPGDVPGVISRYDSPGRAFEPGPLPQDLDSIAFPQYEWFGPNIYKNFNGYQLTPIIISRGCRWSRCAFCTERFFWRTRSPYNFVDELEWLYQQGCDLFMINDSDFNGDHAVVREICQEILRRGLTVRLTGQLRIDRKNTLAFFELLRRAGFVSVRFGVDAWSDNTLKIARKGYTVETIYENLKNCHAAGIYSEINLIVGYPGETAEDVEITIQNILSAKPFIGRFAVINPLMLKVGSIFWNEAEKYKIHFRGNKNQLFGEYPFGIPSKYWFSLEPFIDEEVRSRRLAQIVSSIRDHGIPIAPVTQTRLGEMQEGKDQIRGKAGFGHPVLAGRENSTPSRTFPQPSEIDFLFKYHDAFYMVKGKPPARFRWFGRVMGLLGVDSWPAGNDFSRGTLLKEGKMRMVREVSPDSVALLCEGFHGYNLIKVGQEYIGLRQGYPLDFEKIDGDIYPSGICYRGRSVIAVKNAIETQVRENPP